MKKNCILILLFCLSVTYKNFSQNKRPAPLGRPSYATHGGGLFFDQSVFLRLGYEQRVRNHFGVEFYLAPSIPLGVSSQFRLLHHFGTVSNSNYTNFDPYVGGSMGAKFMINKNSSPHFGAFSGFRIMPNPDYGFYVETGINYVNERYSDVNFEVQIQIGICRRFLYKKPI